VLNGSFFSALARFSNNGFLTQLICIVFVVLFLFFLPLLHQGGVGFVPRPPKIMQGFFLFYFVRGIAPKLVSLLL